MPGSLGATMVAMVTGAATTLASHAASQVTALAEIREGAITRAAARIALRAVLEAIARTARAAALDMPGFTEKFCMPLGHGNQALFAHALAVSKNAEPLVSVFVKHDYRSE